MKGKLKLEIKHPECDVRDCLSANDADFNPYTIKRVTDSYELIENILSKCDGLKTGKALDIGCGSGFDSFAFGLYFDHVLAIDKSRQAIAEAKRVARCANVSNIIFKWIRTERFFSETQFDFVFCNLMSHNVHSRRELLRLIDSSVNSHGWLFYSEAIEGYPLMEIHRAIMRRDSRELVNRLYQAIHGFIGKSCFRFFASGTAESQLVSLGMRVIDRKLQTWNGVPFAEYLLCNKVNGASESLKDISDMDYDHLPDQFAGIRSVFNEYYSARPAKGFTNNQRLRICGLAEDDSNRYAPFLLVLLMLDMVVSKVPRVFLFSGRSGLFFLTRVLKILGESDWAELNRLSKLCIRLAREVSGLDGAAFED